MPKKTTSKTETEQVATPAVVAAPAEKKPRKVADAPVVVETAAPATATATETPTETPLADQSVEFLAKIQQLGVLISSLKAEYKTLEKKWSREVKTAQKLSSKRKRKAGNRAPSGFVKPTKISDELASFLGKDKGAEMARTDVTREINTYIRAHKLQDKDNGRKINPDTKLASLLKLKKTDELTYFNLQKYMSPHFAKAVKAEVAATVV
ncbi:MAG: SWIB/MDM2 domain-containing protein [Candidatus Marinimicrobia bacterium]|nr:SWIB/MDM2 domain-containing protein [Candidatus Neomarinimicrobiota bacterium]